jgi:hypothetical protein
MASAVIELSTKINESLDVIKQQQQKPVEHHSTIGNIKNLGTIVGVGLSLVGIIYSGSIAYYKISEFEKAISNLQTQIHSTKDHVFMIDDLEREVKALDTRCTTNWRTHHQNHILSEKHGISFNELGTNISNGGVLLSIPEVEVKHTISKGASTHKK